MTIKGLYDMINTNNYVIILFVIEYIIKVIFFYIIG